MVFYYSLFLDTLTVSHRASERHGEAQCGECEAQLHQESIVARAHTIFL
jgi:hypothetical protein